ncbi:hypothetical protein GM415_12015 [Pseudodesulfovibrio cashew]|uniref:Shikimate kinase n=1 Tax=Pseudodesulfovibrio cashew TaxID=2678688 RepID=A0A6I6JI08_9BACT|nr:hypothetical protein [Pseudodesulfovibrio cashew]QGY40819.1 hypothetical protein GM415_12015 [Pseudodesulfovibrio cashew]
MGKYLINEEYDVEEAGATKSFAKGDRREDYADAWRNTGNVILMGLPGSGKRALADLLAERTGLPVVAPGDAERAVEALGGENRIIILNDTIMEAPTVRPLVHGAGKGFYLMNDSNTLADRVAQRDGVEDRDALWRELSARLAVMEPLFYETLHFILQPGQTPEEMVEDALEKIAY